MELSHETYLNPKYTQLSMNEAEHHHTPECSDLTLIHLYCHKMNFAELCTHNYYYVEWRPPNYAFKYDTIKLLHLKITLPLKDVWKSILKCKEKG